MIETLDMLGATSKAYQDVRNFFLASVKIYLVQDYPENLGYFSLLTKLFSETGSARTAALRDLGIAVHLQEKRVADRGYAAGTPFRTFLPLLAQCHNLGSFPWISRYLVSSTSTSTPSMLTSLTLVYYAVWD